ncbi:MAG: spore gernimation protein GerC [Paenibacillus sp.]|nr:spore gernimation protein GerC [Paenibacillus sp.]
MRRYVFIAGAILSLLLQAGCWDKAELTEYGFVQAVAVDHNENDQVELTTLFYKPSGGGEQGITTNQKGQPSLIIKTQAETVFEAIRDIPVMLGRKAKWDHMRVILISEKSAREHSLKEILDYFSRDHEPRATVLMMIAKGNDVSKYLMMKPFIENTIGQQLRKTEETGALYSAKTTRTTFLDVAMQLKNQTGVGAIPFLSESIRVPGSPAVAGLALIKNGKMVELIASKDVQYLIMMTKQFRSGVIEVPCVGKEGQARKKESFEVVKLVAKLNPIVSKGKVTVNVNINIMGDANELYCSSLLTPEETTVFQNQVVETVEENLKRVIEHLQKEKIDALGIGDKLSRKEPQLWKKWKEDWDEHFAESQFSFKIKVDVRNTGTTVGKTF